MSTDINDETHEATERRAREIMTEIESALIPVRTIIGEAAKEGYFIQLSGSTLTGTHLHVVPTMQSWLNSVLGPFFGKMKEDLSKSPEPPKE